MNGFLTFWEFSSGLFDNLSVLWLHMPRPAQCRAEHRYAVSLAHGPSIYGKSMPSPPSLPPSPPHTLFLSFCLFRHLLLRLPLTDRRSDMQTLQTCSFSKGSLEKSSRKSLNKPQVISIFFPAYLPCPSLCAALFSLRSHKYCHPSPIFIFTCSTSQFYSVCFAYSFPVCFHDLPPCSSLPIQHNVKYDSVGITFLCSPRNLTAGHFNNFPAHRGSPFFVSFSAEAKAQHLFHLTVCFVIQRGVCVHPRNRCIGYLGVVPITKTGWLLKVLLRSCPL